MAAHSSLMDGARRWRALSAPPAASVIHGNPIGQQFAGCAHGSGSSLRSPESMRDVRDIQPSCAIALWGFGRAYLGTYTTMLPQELRAHTPAAAAPVSETTSRSSGNVGQHHISAAVQSVDVMPSNGALWVVVLPRRQEFHISRAQTKAGELWPGAQPPHELLQLASGRMRSSEGIARCWHGTSALDAVSPVVAASILAGFARRRHSGASLGGHGLWLAAHAAAQLLCNQACGARLAATGAAMVSQYLEL